MLPALAHYFGVSVDALIGMDQMAKAEKYDEVNRLWKENNRRGRHQENVVLMRDSLRTFPNDGLLLVQLSTSLEKLDGTKEEKAKYLRESIALQEQILSYAPSKQHVSRRQRRGRGQHNGQPPPLIPSFHPVAHSGAFPARARRCPWERRFRIWRDG